MLSLFCILVNLCKLAVNQIDFLIFGTFFVCSYILTLYRYYYTYEKVSIAESSGCSKSFFLGTWLAYSHQPPYIQVWSFE